MRKYLIILVLSSHYNVIFWLLITELNVQMFSVACVYDCVLTFLHQGAKARRGDKGDLGFKGDMVSLSLPVYLHSRLLIDEIN